MGQGYASDRWQAVMHEMTLCGNDRATLLLTPQAGTHTTAETKTHTTTLKHEAFGRAVKIKNLLYLVDTAYTGTGCSLALDVYLGTTSSGSLAVTSEAALAIATSSDLNINAAATDYIRIYARSTTTASAANNAIGILKVLYEERFTNA